MQFGRSTISQSTQQSHAFFWASQWEPTTDASSSVQWYILERYLNHVDGPNLKAICPHREFWTTWIPIRSINLPHHGWAVSYNFRYLLRCCVRIGHSCNDACRALKTPSTYTMSPPLQNPNMKTILQFLNSRTIAAHFSGFSASMLPFLCSSIDIWFPFDQIADVQHLIKDVYTGHYRELDGSTRTHSFDYDRNMSLS